MKACFHVKTSYLPDAESGDDDKGDASNVHGQPAASSASSDCSPCLKQCEEISQVMTVLSDEKDSDASSKVKQPKRRWTEGELEAFICAFGHYITKSHTHWDTKHWNFAQDRQHTVPQIRAQICNYIKQKLL